MSVIDRVRRASAVGATMLGLVVALVGCAKYASNDSVEDQIKSQLGTDGADCPEDLKGEVGRSIVCTATRGGETFPVKVTVTSVDGNTINFDIQRIPAAPATAVPATNVDTAPPTAAQTVDGRNVAQSVFDQLASSGKQVNKVSCPDLQARVGASQRCSLVSGDQTYGVTVTVTSVQGTDVKFDIQVDQKPQ